MMIEDIKVCFMALVVVIFMYSITRAAKRIERYELLRGSLVTPSYKSGTAKICMMTGIREDLVLHAATLHMVANRKHYAVKRNYDFILDISIDKAWSHFWLRTVALHSAMHARPDMYV